jgi:hypothetical protein
MHFSMFTVAAYEEIRDLRGEVQQLTVSQDRGFAIPSPSSNTAFDRLVSFGPLMTNPLELVPGA